MQFNFDTTIRPNAIAKKLRRELNTRDVKITLGQALDATARLYGYPNWTTLSRQAGRNPRSPDDAECTIAIRQARREQQIGVIETFVSRIEAEKIIAALGPTSSGQAGPGEAAVEEIGLEETDLEQASLGQAPAEIPLFLMGLQLLTWNEKGRIGYAAILVDPTRDNKLVKSWGVEIVDGREIRCLSPHVDVPKSVDQAREKTRNFKVISPLLDDMGLSTEKSKMLNFADKHFQKCLEPEQARLELAALASAHAWFLKHLDLGLLKRLKQDKATFNGEYAFYMVDKDLRAKREAAVALHPSFERKITSSAKITQLIDSDQPFEGELAKAIMADKDRWDIEYGPVGRLTKAHMERLRSMPKKVGSDFVPATAVATFLANLPTSDFPATKADWQVLVKMFPSLWMLRRHLRMPIGSLVQDVAGNWRKLRSDLIERFKPIKEPRLEDPEMRGIIQMIFDPVNDILDSLLEPIAVAGGADRFWREQHYWFAASLFYPPASIFEVTQIATKINARTDPLTFLPRSGVSTADTVRQAGKIEDVFEAWRPYLHGPASQQTFKEFSSNPEFLQADTKRAALK